MQGGMTTDERAIPSPGANMTTRSDITGLLQEWQGGDRDALDRLAPLVYQELRRIARRYMSAESPGHTLQPTALVNEALERLVRGDIDYKGRKHFFVIAARMMRRILVDHARARQRDKRGGGDANLTLDESLLAGEDGADSLAILDLDRALSELAESDARMAQAVEIVCFGGLSPEVAAESIGVSRTTIFEDLRFARAWLRTRMQA